MTVDMAKAVEGAISYGSGLLYRRLHKASYRAANRREREMWARNRKQASE